MSEYKVKVGDIFLWRNLPNQKSYGVITSIDVHKISIKWSDQPKEAKYYHYDVQEWLNKKILIPSKNSNDIWEKLNQ